MLNWLAWNRTIYHLTVSKQMTDVSDTKQYLELFNFVDLCLQIIYI